VLHTMSTANAKAQQKMHPLDDLVRLLITVFQ
jgi:hypothetical protein